MITWGSFNWGEALWFGFIEPVFDRTQADCDNGTAKGFINAVDLNRIEVNIQYVDYLLRSMNYDVSIIENEEFPWSRVKYLRTAQLNNIKQSVQRMRDKFASYPNIPEITLSADGAEVLYGELNLIEYCLYDLVWLINKTQIMTPHVGDFMVGDFFS